MAKYHSEEEILRIQSLLKKHSQTELVQRFLEEIQGDNILFRTSDKKAKENSRENLLLAWQLKAAWEKNRTEGEKTTEGYEELIAGLSRTEAKHIKISEFTSPKATFFIFSDFEITEFIGILKSGQTLGDLESKLTKL